MTSRSPCPSSRAQTAHSQAYYYWIFACALLAVGSIALSENFPGACCGHYKYESKLTAFQRTLMIQVIVLTAYYLLGALAYSHIESWSFLDTLCWADLTLLTIGLGHILTPRHP
jgi:potassium channel subfamily K